MCDNLEARKKNKTREAARRLSKKPQVLADINLRECGNVCETGARVFLSHFWKGESFGLSDSFYKSSHFKDDSKM
jgi:hypothetical protein